ncbi:MAG: trehalase family glycosidase [Planctomycetota bacterium]|nr:trehalase family glycosidase [Planctomycetota bacterium]
MIRLPKSFPISNYTPHGYIDNPFHSMVLHRSGAIRSVPPLGFGYWLTGFEGSYGGGQRDHVNYLSLLLMSVGVGGTTFATPEDFKPHGFRLSSRYHTKHLLSYDWTWEGLTFSLKFFLPRENSLACLAEIASAGGSPREVLLHATHIYGLWDRKYWGSDGVAAKYDEKTDTSVSKIWAYGHAFVLGSDHPSAAHKATPSEEEWLQWVRQGDLSSIPGSTVVGPGPMRTVQSYRVAVPACGGASVLVLLSRGVNETRAAAEFKSARRTFRPSLKRQLAADEAFWARAPMLEGDWPATWKHGWVYDFETLRMNVRHPIGIYRHHWDAMQIHAPRAVLGESSLDAMALSYADPNLAMDVLLGTFADAPAPNVPCSREDGSMNMIAADGAECGTYPAWGLPGPGIRSIHARPGSPRGSRALYPPLGAGIRGGLKNQADADGWLHCKCSWEAQDGSKRFLIPEGGHEGTVSEHVRTVDAEAAMAEAMRNMARFAEIAGRPADGRRWRRMAEERTHRVRAMYVDGWFRDFDARTGRPIILQDYYDVMMLVPLACGVATDEQMEAIRPRIECFRTGPAYWLEWPSFVFPLSEAAWNAGLRTFLAEMLAEIADRLYARSDRPTVTVPKSCVGKPFEYRVPGQAAEYWPVDPEPAYGGGECYGWGATLPTNLIRNLIGFRETDRPGHTEFLLAPALPERFRQAGGTYGISNLRFGPVTLRATYRVARMDQLRITLDFAATRPGTLTVSGQEGPVLATGNRKSKRGSVSFDATNGAIYAVRFD